MRNDYRNEDTSHFVAVNLDQQEYIESRNLDTTERSITVFASDILVYLLYGSVARDGGDSRTRDEYPNLGRWADDRVITASKYTLSNFYHEERSGAEYEEISEEIRDEVTVLFDRALES
jgi:hypothetical protein